MKAHHLLLALLLSAPGLAREHPPNLTIALPPKGAPDQCFVAGELRTVEGRWIDVDPETGRNRPPVELTLMVRNTSRERETLPVVFLEDGITWRVESVNLGDADGMAVVTVRGRSVSGKKARTARAWKVDAGPPVVDILVDGVPAPTDPAGDTTRLYGRPVRIGAAVTDAAHSAPPRPEITVDGRPHKDGHPVETEGLHHAVATATDCAGHRSSAEYRFRIDRSPPPLVSTEPADGATIPGRPDRFEGVSGPDLVQATVGGRRAVVTDGRFVVEDFRWVEGKNEVRIELEDRAGLVSRHEITFTVRSLGPTLKLLELGLPFGPDRVFRRPVYPEWDVTGTGITVTATVDGEPFTEGAAVDTPGRHRLEVVVTDRFGREVRDEVEFTIEQKR